MFDKIMDWMSDLSDEKPFWFIMICYGFGAVAAVVAIALMYGMFAAIDAVFGTDMKKVMLK